MAEGTSEAPVEFDRFFEDEYPRLVRALYLITANPGEAEDLVQEAMARVYARWDRVREMASPAGYVYKTALNIHRKRLRRVALTLRTLLPGSDSGDPASDVALRSDVARALQALPQGQRVALVLTEWMGLSTKEAAAILGIQVGAVRVRLHRALAALRDSLGGSHE